MDLRCSMDAEHNRWFQVTSCFKLLSPVPSKLWKVLALCIHISWAFWIPLSLWYTVFIFSACRRLSHYQVGAARAAVAQPWAGKLLSDILIALVSKIAKLRPEGKTLGSSRTDGRAGNHCMLTISGRKFVTMQAANWYRRSPYSCGMEGWMVQFGLE